MRSHRSLTCRKATGLQRRGAIAVLAVVLMVMALAMVAFSVDLGYMMVAKTDLQRAADASAHAAVLEFRGDGSATEVITGARETARQYAEDNDVLHSAVTIDPNFYNTDPEGDVVVGRIDFDDPRGAMTFGDADEFNAVRVTIRRSAEQNGEVALFFGAVLGQETMSVHAKATAAIIKNVGGFKIPGSGENVPFLPITVDEDYWEQNLAGGVDDWSYDASDQSISQESDGVSEVVLFPSDPNSAGNFGTLNVGTSDNSTSHLAGQIRDGLSPSDLAYHGGELALDSSGKLLLSGDPGLSASLKDDLNAISGKPVAIPIYRRVSNNGNNAEFVIVKFVGVRIVAVNLSGGQKFVSIQPANVTFKGAIQASAGSEGTSQNIYSPPILVQ